MREGTLFEEGILFQEGGEREKLLFLEGGERDRVELYDIESPRHLLLQLYSSIRAPRISSLLALYKSSDQISC
jgi:hypothetical protein